MSTEIEVVNPTSGAMTVPQLREQVNLIQNVMKEVMHKDEHYGVIPGCAKPSLYKAGAEKLCLVFRLDPQYEITERQEEGHLTITSKCTLYHITSGKRLGSGMGSCSTKESKYAYRTASRVCPECGKETIIKGKEEYGGGWLCFAKKGGCGAKFENGSKAIESQAQGRVPNEDIADQYNTVLKMANKRSLIAGVLNVTAASDIFTQDVEDMKTAVEPEKTTASNPVTPEVLGPEDHQPSKTEEKPKTKAPETLEDLKSQMDLCKTASELNRIVQRLTPEFRTKAVMEYYGYCLKNINSKK